jgi:hypothetical protein
MKAKPVRFRKGQPKTAGGLPYLVGFAEQPCLWGLMADIDRACTLWLLRRGIIHPEDV